MALPIETVDNIDKPYLLGQPSGLWLVAHFRQLDIVYSRFEVTLTEFIESCHRK